MKRQLDNEKLKMEVFKTPEGYFEHLSEAIQDKQNLTAWQTQPEKFATSHYFKVPPNYFGQLPQRIWSRIGQLKQTSATQSLWEKVLTWINAFNNPAPATRWALATVVLLVGSSLSIYFGLKNKQSFTHHELLTATPSFLKELAQSSFKPNNPKAGITDPTNPVKQDPVVAASQVATIPDKTTNLTKASDPTVWAQNIEAMPPTLSAQVPQQVKAATILAELTTNDIWAYLEEEELSAQEALDYWLTGSSSVVDDHWELDEIETLADYLKSRDLEGNLDIE